MYNKEAQERYKILCELEKKLETKVIAVMGISTSAQLDDLAADKIIMNLQAVGQDKDITIVLHTFGGIIEAGWKIAKEILGRTGKTSIVVPYVAKSTGTLVAISGTRIIARNLAEFGPADPQIPVYRSSTKIPLSAHDLMINGNEAEKIHAENSLKETKDYLRAILERRYPESNKEEILKILLREDIDLQQRSHNMPLLSADLNGIGIAVIVNELTDFCRLYEKYLNDRERHLLDNATHMVEMVPS